MTASPSLTRRDFIAATTALVASAHGPLAATGQPRPAPASSTDGTVILFQGDSITDCGRNRADAQPNGAGALGTGYPLLVASAALATHPDRGLRFYNRGVSGNTVPDLEQRWPADTLELRPDVLSILIGVNDFWHKLGGGYTGTVQDYEDQYTAARAHPARPAAGAPRRARAVRAAVRGGRRPLVSGIRRPAGGRRTGRRPRPRDLRPAAGGVRRARPHRPAGILGGRRRPSHAGGTCGDRGAVAPCRVSVARENHPGLHAREMIERRRTHGGRRRRL